MKKINLEYLNPFGAGILCGSMPNELIERFYPEVNPDGEMYADLQLNYRSSWLLEKLYRANPVFKESFTFVYTKTGLVRNMISDLYFTDDHLITH